MFYYYEERYPLRISHIYSNLMLEVIQVSEKAQGILQKMFARPSREIDVMLKNIESLIDLHSLLHVPSTNTNAVGTFLGTRGDVTTILTLFSDFYTVQTVFGEVGHEDTRARPVRGFFGSAYASSAYRSSAPVAGRDGIIPGSGIEGNNIIGLKFRISICNRFNISAAVDRYIVSDDIVSTLTALRHAVPTSKGRVIRGEYCEMVDQWKSLSPGV